MGTELEAVAVEAVRGDAVTSGVGGTRLAAFGKLLSEGNEVSTGAGWVIHPSNSTRNLGRGKAGRAHSLRQMQSSDSVRRAKQRVVSFMTRDSCQFDRVKDQEPQAPGTKTALRKGRPARYSR